MKRNFLFFSLFAVIQFSNNLDAAYHYSVGSRGYTFAKRHLLACNVKGDICREGKGIDLKQFTPEAVVDKFVKKYWIEDCDRINKSRTILRIYEETQRMGVASIFKVTNMLKAMLWKYKKLGNDYVVDTVYFLRLDAKNIDELYNKTKEDLHNTLLIYNSLYDLGIIKVDISGTPNSNYIIHKDNIINVYGCIKKYNPKIQIQSVIDLFRDMFTEYHVISNEKISRMIWDECFNIAYKKNFASLEILRDNVIEKLDEQQNMIQEEVD